MDFYIFRKSRTPFVVASLISAASIVWKPVITCVLICRYVITAVSYFFSFNVPHKEKSKGIILGDLGAQLHNPKRLKFRSIKVLAYLYRMRYRSRIKVIPTTLICFNCDCIWYWYSNIQIISKVFIENQIHVSIVY